MLTEKITILYRGSLKSCNYRCGYCPFSKHRGTEREYERDRQQWFRFVESLAKGDERGRGREADLQENLLCRRTRGQQNQPLSVGAVMVVPYGEALIHSWYWQGLGRLSAGEEIDCVGAQTNLSFPAEESLEEYRKAGGRPEKLRLWATFHPEMTSVEAFVRQCGKIRREGAGICAGVVGVPENLEIIRRLKQELPEDIYLWVNKMDGLGRPYTEEEIQAFRETDPFFGRELISVEADIGQCRNRIFVEADGKIRRCNISRTLEGSWYDGSPLPEGRALSEKVFCGRKRCSCYLAYGGREDVMNRILFGPYPLFRIPRKAKAAFLDIEGTLIPRGQKEISPFTRADLELAAAQGEMKLFFATTLPVREARKRCWSVWHLFSGGIFAGGAHVVLNQGLEQGRLREMFYPLDRRWTEIFEQEAEKRKARILVCENGNTVCKITLLRPGHLPWLEEEIREVDERCRRQEGNPIRLFAEGSCLQAVSEEASKARGVKTLCKWLGIAPWEAAAAGDSDEDLGMMDLCGYDAGGINRL